MPQHCPASSCSVREANPHPAASDDFEDVVVGMPGMAAAEASGACWYHMDTF